MITLALVCFFGHVPRLICAIFRSFQFFYSTDLLISFSYSSFNFSVSMRRVRRNLVVTLCMGSLFSTAFLLGPLYYFL